MTQLTLRGFDPELEKRLRDQARRDHISLNKAALKLMRRGAGLEAEVGVARPIGEQLKRYSGRMSSDESRRINQAIKQARKEDTELQG